MTMTLVNSLYPFVCIFNWDFGKTLPHCRRSIALALFILFLFPLLLFELSDRCRQCSHLRFFDPLSLILFHRLHWSNLCCNDFNGGNTS